MSTRVLQAPWGAWSPQSNILAFMEQQNIYHAINFNVASEGGGGAVPLNWTAQTFRINTFLCPSSPVPVGTQNRGGVNGNLLPGNNYFASMGASMMPRARAGAPDANPKGLFNCDVGDGGGRAVTIAHIRDGTSNTIAFGEWRMGDGDINMLSIQDVIRIGTSPPGVNIWFSAQTQMPEGAAAFEQWIVQCAGYAPQSLGQPDGRNKSFIGDTWHNGEAGHGLGNTLLPPNSRYPNCSAAAYNPGSIGDTAGIYGMSSFHPGGANVCFADGSVRFIKDTLDMRIVWALGSKAGGEVVSSDQY